MNLQLLNEMMGNSVKNKEYGHWEIMPYLLDQDPLKAHGFVYCVENTETGKLYIGRKQTVHLGKKSSKTYGKTTNWKSYMGSSKHLTDDIKSLGKDKFKFVILEFYQTRGGLNYAEIAFQIKCDVMTAKLPDGERQFYNGQVGAVRWIPKEFISEKSRLALVGNKRKLGYTLTDDQKQNISDSRRGIVFTEEHKENISKAKKGTRLSQAHKDKLSSLRNRATSVVIEKGDKLHIFSCILDAAKFIGCSEGGIRKVLAGVRNAIYGWKVSYLKENN
jgi:group I intron endonuclease